MDLTNMSVAELMKIATADLHFDGRCERVEDELTRRIGDADALRAELVKMGVSCAEDLAAEHAKRMTAEKERDTLRAEVERLTRERDGWKAEAMQHPHTLDGVRIVPKMRVWRIDDDDIDGEPFVGWIVGEVSLGRAGRWSVLLEGLGPVVNPMLYSSLEACRAANDASKGGAK